MRIEVPNACAGGRAMIGAIVGVGLQLAACLGSNRRCASFLTRPVPKRHGETTITSLTAMPRWERTHWTREVGEQGTLSGVIEVGHPACRVPQITHGSHLVIKPAFVTADIVRHQHGDTT